MPDTRPQNDGPVLSGTTNDVLKLVGAQRLIVGTGKDCTRPALRPQVRRKVALGLEVHRQIEVVLGRQPQHGGIVEREPGGGQVVNRPAATAIEQAVQDRPPATWAP